MHFAIPDTQEIIAEFAYTGYKIYINGFYHCCLRYKQLYALHELIKRRCGGDLKLPKFPPKRLLPLTSNQVETRRAALEYYLQMVGQNASMAKMDFFQNFLLNAQIETALSEEMLDDESNFNHTNTITSMSTPITLEIWLMNGCKLQVNCHLNDNTHNVLIKACENLDLSKQMVSYFCLFLVRNDSANNLILLRRLMDFETPYISRQRAMPCHLLIRKSYWNPMYDRVLMKNVVSLNLLYIQTVSDIENEWIIALPDVREKLQNMQNHDLKKEYLEIARHLPLYGCLQFSLAQVDYPEAQTAAIISIGNKELSMRTTKELKVYETKFRVTRMRCWRVTALHNTMTEKDVPSNLQLSFEYLMSKQCLRWITINSPQAMLMSVCLQNMVDELLNTNFNNSTDNSPSSNERLSVSSSTPSFSSEVLSTPTSTNTSISSSSLTSSPTAPVKFLQQKCTKQNSKINSSNSYSAVLFRNVEDSVHNEAFEGIGDDDL